MPRMGYNTDGVHPIGDIKEGDTRIADIVFVHGLTGRSHETWEHGERGKDAYFFWPEELAKDMPKCGVWSVGYPTGLVKGAKMGACIERIATNLVLPMANRELGKYPLIFITHSMGGLVVKALIVSDHRPKTDRKSIIDNTCGIVFCATPHRGTELVNAAKKLARLFINIGGYIDEMEKDSERQDILHSQFIKWMAEQKVTTQCYAETMALKKSFLRIKFPLGIVVDRKSAGLANGEDAYEINGVDHVNIVKPEHKEHDVYKGVLRFVRGLTKQIERPVSSSNGTGSSEEKRSAQNGAPTIHMFTKSKIVYTIEFELVGDKILKKMRLSYVVRKIQESEDTWKVVYSAHTRPLKAIYLLIDGVKKECGPIQSEGFPGMGAECVIPAKGSAKIEMCVVVECGLEDKEEFSTLHPATGLILEYKKNKELILKVNLMRPDAARKRRRGKTGKWRRDGYYVREMRGDVLPHEGFCLTWKKR
jgi:hypothetical protein